MLNALLLLFILCVLGFLVSLFFQLARIENTLKSLLQNIEKYLIKQYGEDGKDEE